VVLRRAAWILFALPFAACGPAAESTTAAGTGAAARTLQQTQPSASALMICADEAQGEIAGAVGAQTTEPVSPTWSNQTYSCRYVYPDGQLVLSVKELADKAATDRDFSAQAQQLGRRRPLHHIGDDGFVASNDSVVIRKDNKVLSVDVTNLPQSFGNPPITREDVAFDVASVIMDCWIGG
jgi:hypothetical protein